MDRYKKRPTQADVARLAQVSQAMVSYVLNNKAEISVPDETRQRILDAMEELGYVPDRIARSLRTRKTKTIACVIPDITNPFHPLFAHGIQLVAETYGYDLILYNTDRLAEKERKALTLLQQGRVDGMIITPLFLSAQELLPLLDLGIPVVVQGASYIPPEVDGYPLDSVYVNNVAAAHTAVAHLLGRGHRRIAMIAGQENTPPGHDRGLGYQRALEQHGLPFERALVCGGGFREEGGYLCMQDLLRLSPRPSAVFVASDLMAVGALLAIKEAGLRVPDDIALVGFDNIPIAKLVHPALTTVAQFQEQMGRRAAEMLFDRLERGLLATGRSVEMPHKLIVRESA